MCALRTVGWLDNHETDSNSLQVGGAGDGDGDESPVH
jgi:hypothetical protein